MRLTSEHCTTWGSCGRSKLQAGSKEGIKRDEQEDRSPAR